MVTAPEELSAGSQEPQQPDGSVTTMMNGLEQRVRARLASLTAAGLQRSLRPPSGIDLCSNDYLKLSIHPIVTERMSAAVMREGCGSTASRLLRGERLGFAALEKEFAAFKAAPSALYFGSGYAANLGVLSTFIEANDLVFSDELNHASLIDGLRLTGAERRIFPHCNIAALTDLIRSSHTNGQRFLITESLFSMDGDEAPLREYAQLCREYNLVLIVDEAHAVGIYGPRGSGLIEEANLDHNDLISINPAGKALGGYGALVAGPHWAIDYLVQRARSFIFSTAPPPALADALMAALQLIEQEPWRREQLLVNSQLLRDLLINGGLSVWPGRSQIIPVMLGENERATKVAQELQAAGFDARAIRPPTVPVGQARLRISINVDLDAEVLRRFADTLIKIIADLERKI